MKRLVSTLNLSKEDWLRYRKCGITGTDAGAILDVNPYRSAFQICRCGKVSGNPNPGGIEELCCRA